MWYVLDFGMDSMLGSAFCLIFECALRPDRDLLSKPGKLQARELDMQAKLLL
jgi:hypothetical protein